MSKNKGDIIERLVIATPVPDTEARMSKVLFRYPLNWDGSHPAPENYIVILESVDESSTNNWGKS